MEEHERILFSEAIKIPSPPIILSLFWQIIMYFWKAERDPLFYRDHVLPHAVAEIPLKIDYRFYQKPRYHIFPMTTEDATGIWDDSCFWIDLAGIRHGNLSPDFMEHGDYRHAYQLFLKSFLRTIKKHTKFHPSLDRIYKLLSRMSILKWKCPVCKKYNSWSRDFIETRILENDLSIAPSTLLFLLNHENVSRGEEECMDHAEIGDLIEILQTTLSRFFTHFTTIYHQTSMNPIIILQNLIEILNKHAVGKNVERIHEFESACAREMKDYIFTQFKFMKTKDVRVSRFPRDLLISRDVFRMLLQTWKKETNDVSTTSTSSPGILILLHNMIFDDHGFYYCRRFDNQSLPLPPSPPLIIFHSSKEDAISMRNMTPPEITDSIDYHPVLRPLLFI